MAAGSGTGPVTAQPAAVVLPVNTETELGTVTCQPGQMTTCVIDRTVSPNAITAKPLNSLTAQTTVLVRIYASTDGSTFYQICGATVTAGTFAPFTDQDGVLLSPPSSSSVAVSMRPGETVHKVTATMASAAAVASAGVSATLAVSAA